MFSAAGSTNGHDFSRALREATTNGSNVWVLLHRRVRARQLAAHQLRSADHPPVLRPPAEAEAVASTAHEHVVSGRCVHGVRLRLPALLPVHARHVQRVHGVLPVPDRLV